MIEFLFYNAVLGILILIQIKSKDLLALATSYLLALYTLVTKLIGSTYPLRDSLANITISNSTGPTLHEYAYNYVSIPANYTDFFYTIILAVMTAYFANKFVLSDMSKKMKGWWKDW